MSLRCAINLCRFKERVIYVSSYYVEWRMQVSKGRRHCVTHTHTHNVPHSLHVIQQTHPANLAVYLSCNFSHLTLWCVSAAAALHRCQVATSSAEKLSQASEVAVHIAATWGWLKKCLVFFHIESHIKCETMQQNLVWKTHCSLKAISPFIQQLYFFGGILDEWISISWPHVWTTERGHLQSTEAFWSTFYGVWGSAYPRWFLYLSSLRT